MDLFVENKLQEWDLFEQLKEQFQANQIDQTVFENLTEADIKELIPVLGIRKKCLIKYQEEKVKEAISHPLVISDKQSDAGSASTITAISSPASSISYITDAEIEVVESDGPCNDKACVYSQKATLGLPYQILPIPDTTNSVKNILDTCEEGKLIYASYGKNKKFRRGDLARLIIRIEINKSSSRRFLRIGLPHCKIIIDYSISKFPTSNLLAEDYCLDNTEDNREVIRVCTEDFQICESSKCIHKCCPDGQSFVNGSFCKATYVYGVNLNFSDKIDQKDFVIVHGYTGKIYLQPLSWDFNLDSDGVFRLFDEKIGNEIYEPTEETYCIEHATKNGIEFGHRLFRMYPKTQIEEKYLINGYVMIVSSLFLLLTVMFYICSGETKKLFGKTLVSFCVCLGLNFLILIYSTFNLDDIKENAGTCYTLGFLLLYGEFATFLWLKLLCFDIYYTFGSGKVRNKPSSSHLKRFLVYSFYGWGLALVLTIIPLALFFTNILPEPIEIVMGNTRCAIERDDGNYADLLFRTMPVTILQLINLILFYKSVKCCIDVKNEIRKMNENQKDKKGKFILNKERFILVIKLSVIMGISYIFEVVSSFYEFNQTKPTKYLEIVWDIINCLQGVFIFLIFICKKKMLDKIKSHSGMKRLRKISLSSAATLTTHLSFDKDKKIQNNK